MRFDFQRLRPLLRRRIDDASVVDLMGVDSSRLERDEYYGSISFANDGVELVFNEAPWVLPATEFTDPRDLYVSGFHFHREGHEGFTEYGGMFPGRVVFNDSVAEVRRKLGNPVSSGGGTFSTLLNKTIPHWMRYRINGELLNLQFDSDGTLEMATLFVEDPKNA